MCVLIHRVLFLAAASMRLETEDLKNDHHSTQVMRHISSNSSMFVGIMSKRLKPMKISLTATVCLTVEKL